MISVFPLVITIFFFTSRALLQFLNLKPGSTFLFTFSLNFRTNSQISVLFAFHILLGKATYVIQKSVSTSVSSHGLHTDLDFLLPYMTAGAIYTMYFPIVSCRVYSDCSTQHISVTFCPKKHKSPD